MLKMYHPIKNIHKIQLNDIDLINPTNMHNPFKIKKKFRNTKIIYFNEHIEKLKAKI